MKLSPFFPKWGFAISASLHPEFSVISSSSLSLLCCFLPWDSVPTLLAPGSVLCYRKWLERAGPWTCPKLHQKTHHPCSFPFAHSQLSLPLASSFAACEGVPGNEHTANPGYHSTFYFLWRKLSSLGPEAHGWPLGLWGEGSVTSASLRQAPATLAPPHMATLPPCVFLSLEFLQLPTIL